MEEKIRTRISRAIAEKVFPGCAIGIVKRNGEGLVLPFGNFTYEGGSPAITENSIFDVASITKSIPTACLALKLIEEKKLSLEDKLIDFVPEFRNADRELVLIKHLLNQTIDYDFRLFDYRDRRPDEILDIIFTTDFKVKPGEKLSYRDPTSILLGLVIEKILGNTLDNLGSEHYFNPLGMSRTRFRPLEQFRKVEIVPTEIDDWRGGVVQGEVHDESAFALGKKMVVGEAGLFSTAPDLLKFLLMLLNGGELNGHQYFSPETINEMHTNQLEDIGVYQGLGWELYQPRYMGQHCTKETFGKTGFTGCVVMCDTSYGVGIVMLSNTTYPRRRPLREHVALINAVRRDITDIAFSNTT